MNMNDYIIDIIKLKEKLRKLEIIEKLEEMHRKKLEIIEEVIEDYKVEKAGKVGQYVVYNDVDFGKIVKIRNDGIYEVLMASDGQIRLFNEVAFSNGKTLKIVE